MPRPTNRSTGHLSWRALACAFIVSLGCSSACWAIDPLPADLEQASPEAKARYLETTGQRSLEEKLKVGRERYQARVEMRQALHKRMMSEVTARQKEIRYYAEGGASRSHLLSFLKPLAILVGCGGVVILLAQAWRRIAVT